MGPLEAIAGPASLVHCHVDAATHLKMEHP